MQRDKIAPIPGWVNNEVIIYDDYDLWQVDPSGKKPPVNITRGYGKKHHIKFRIAEQPEGEPAQLFSAGDTILLTAFNDETKYNGFWRLILRKRPIPELLTMGPYTYYRTPSQKPHWYKFDDGMLPIKASNANCWVVKRQSSKEAPNFFFTNNFKTFTPLSKIEPQSGNNWLSTELIRYKQRDGITCQGVLYKPEDFNPAKKYPVLFNCYDQLSHRMYEFPMPGYTDSNINIPWFVSHGYLVFTQDIYYSNASVTNRTSGQAAYNSIFAAAKYLARQSPDYMESFGLGFMEYFQLCEDIGAAPMPIINCGMSCQFDAAEVIPVNELQPFIQDALDLIEFANGDANTQWGRRRMDLGHPTAFNMKMLGVGNENWGPQYAERLDLFTKAIKAIKAKYPYIQIINATGYSRNIFVFTYMDSVLRARHADIIDEHFYDTPAWFMQNANRYDKYDRNGPKIFVGEYAAQTDRIRSQKNVNNLIAALSEACFMTGLERNADVVSMASYAPLFAHVKDWQWTPNLIWFDNQTSYNTPSYYVQQLFSLNKGTDVIPISDSPLPTSPGLPLNPPPTEGDLRKQKSGEPICGQDSVWASAVLDKSTNELIMKLVNPSATAKQKTIAIGGLNKPTGIGEQIILTASTPDAVNAIEQPDAVRPVTSQIVIKNRKVSVQLPAHSFSVIKCKQ